MARDQAPKRAQPLRARVVLEVTHRQVVHADRRPLRPPRRDDRDRVAEITQRSRLIRHERLGDDREAVDPEVQRRARACVRQRALDRSVGAHSRGSRRQRQDPVVHLQQSAAALTAQQEGGGADQRPAQLAERVAARPRRLRPAAVDPVLAGTGDHALAPHVGERLAVRVLDGSLVVVEQLPAGLLRAPAEVDVLGVADALEEAAELAPDIAAYQQVGGVGPAPLVLVERVALVEPPARGSVLGGRGALVLKRRDATGDDRRVVGRWVREVGVDQVRLGDAVAVDEQHPIAARSRGAGVSTACRRAFADGRRRVPRRRQIERREHLVDAVVANHDLVALGEPQTREALDHLARVVRTACERDDNRDRGAQSGATVPPLRVLLVLHEEQLGGASIAALRTLAPLVEEGLDLHVWCARPSPLHDYLEAAGYQVAGTPRPWRYSLARLREPPGIARRLGHVPSSLRAFNRHLRALAPDLVHANATLSLPEAVVA